MSCAVIKLIYYFGYELLVTIKEDVALVQTGSGILQRFLAVNHRAAIVCLQEEETNLLATVSLDLSAEATRAGRTAHLPTRCLLDRLVRLRIAFAPPADFASFSRP